MKPDDIVTRLGSGMRARVVAVVEGRVYVDYVAGPLRGQSASYRLAEFSDFFTYASYPPVRGF